MREAIMNFLNFPNILRRCCFLSSILILLVLPASGAEPADPAISFAGELIFHTPFNQEGEPGDFVTYVFQIDNVSTVEKSLTISKSSNPVLL
jgi:hypothetical protein